MDYDLIIIGAGIHGAAIAQAAAAHGYRTRVLEQYSEPAQGTSSKSSKLIHGGLRYLESGQLRLVRECLVERGHLLDNAPHLVQLQPFHIPVYRHTGRPAWLIFLGLSLYALLGGRGFKRIPRKDWKRLDGLRTADLQTVFQYQDAQTDDALLTRAVLASATALGAEINYGCTFNQARCDADCCDIEYSQAGQTQHLRTRTLVNSTGPWVNDVLQHVEPHQHPLNIDLVQGTHIVIPGMLEHGLYYMEAPQDRRAVFVMPWREHILMGTTETLYSGDPAAVRPLESEIEYLLEVYNHYFERPVARADVIEAFAGLRVLPQTAKSAFNRSRDTLLHSDATGSGRVLSIYGGKLTSHRATGEAVIARLRPLLPKREQLADTRTLPLPDVEKL